MSIHAELTAAIATQAEADPTISTIEVGDHGLIELVAATSDNDRARINISGNTAVIESGFPETYNSFEVPDIYLPGRTTDETAAAIIATAKTAMNEVSEEFVGDSIFERPAEPVTLHVKVPASWYAILHYGEFDDEFRDPFGREVRDGENHRQGLDDDELYYDDVRIVSFEQGSLHGQIALCSGQSNYWVGYDCYDGDNFIGEDIDHDLGPCEFSEAAPTYTSTGSDLMGREGQQVEVDPDVWKTLIHARVDVDGSDGGDPGDIVCSFEGDSRAYAPDQTIRWRPTARNGAINDVVIEPVPVWDNTKRAIAIDVVKHVAGLSKRAAATVVDTMNFTAVNAERRTQTVGAVMGVLLQASTVETIADLISNADDRLVGRTDVDSELQRYAVFSSAVTGEELLSVWNGQMHSSLNEPGGTTVPTGADPTGGPNPLLAARRIRKAIHVVEAERVEDTIMTHARVLSSDGQTIVFEGLPDDLGHLRTCDGDHATLLGQLAFAHGPDLWMSGTLHRDLTGKRPVMSLSRVDIKDRNEEAALTAVRLLEDHPKPPTTITRDGRRVAAIWNDQ